jgi:hypothetical protein
MPRIERIVDFDRMGMYIWTLPDGEEQQEHDWEWKADSDEQKRRREGCEGAPKGEGLDQLRWMLSYDVFIEGSNLSDMISHFIYRRRKS